ncbi:MAG: serine hydrolase domain-containing protein [Candidatus Hodarchaeales archaeon]|jgi:CubicO group peptidase (beta-lactamase class C family)
MKKKSISQGIRFLLILTLVALMVYTGFGQASTETVVTMESWETSTPEAQGMDSRVLENLEKHTLKTYPNIYSMVIVRNGCLVEEEYFKTTDTTKRNIYSCTKSFTSALIGIAIQEGYIEGINTSVLDFFPSYTFTNIDERKQNMTIYHLLTMTAGLEWNEADYNDPQNPLYLMWDSTDWVQYVLDLKMVDDPGQTFSYNSGASHILSAIISYSTGMSTSEYAETRLFSPLGIEEYYWPTDPQGVPKGGEGLELTPRELAKLGQLYLNNGTWKDQQIVPKDWVSNSTQYSLNPPTSNYYGYGFQWWIHPGGIFSAWGYAHQRVIVVPEYQVVATFTSYMPTISGDPAASLVNEYILPAIFDHENYEEPTTSTENSVTAFVFILPTLILMVLNRKNQSIE